MLSYRPIRSRSADLPGARGVSCPLRDGVSCRSLLLVCCATKVNLKLNAFLKEKEAREEEERRKRAEQARAKIVERVEAEKAEVRPAASIPKGLRGRDLTV